MRASGNLRRGVAAAFGCGVLLGLGCAASPPPQSLSWEEETRLAVDSIRGGNPQGGVTHYERAREVAREPRQSAYANWHLGDACFRYDGLGGPGEAESTTRVSLVLFGELYGPEHPVVIPILLRLSVLAARRGDADSSAALLAEADRIITRTFPESHFMRAQSGSQRPASQLHPLQMLKILVEFDRLGG